MKIRWIENDFVSMFGAGCLKLTSNLNDVAYGDHKSQIKC